jgi:hypothetical protein
METVIVAGTAALAVAFTAAWALSPGFRAWLEHPKYTFADNARRHDEARRRHTGEAGPGPAGRTR